MGALAAGLELQARSQAGTPGTRGDVRWSRETSSSYATLAVQSARDCCGVLLEQVLARDIAGLCYYYWIPAVATGERVCRARARIPTKRMRRRGLAFSPFLYRYRNLAERFFGKPQRPKGSPHTTTGEPTTASPPSRPSRRASGTEVTSLTKRIEHRRFRCR